MVRNYRKRPVVIQALQYTGDNFQEVQDFLTVHIVKTMKGFILPTLEGDMEASKGDFIIRGVNGEYYPCKPDIFEKTYEEVD